MAFTGSALYFEDSLLDLSKHFPNTVEELQISHSWENTPFLDFILNPRMATGWSYGPVQSLSV